MYLSYWITMESREVPSPLMQSRQSNENISDAIPVESQTNKNKQGLSKISEQMAVRI